MNCFAVKYLLVLEGLPEVKKHNYRGLVQRRYKQTQFRVERLA